MPNLARSAPKSWSSTLRLPKSTFPARLDPLAKPKYLKQCTDDLYAWQSQARADQSSPRFTLHDGPPYANGSLHIGHALNKILKDVICRVQLAQGKRVHYTPGWDCHGLPIEQKALQLLQKTNEEGNISRRLGAVATRKAARELATRTVEEQKQGFQQWGIMGDWNHAWKSMDKNFEMKQLEVFRGMVDRGLIQRRFKPVYWSPSSGTALAEAELEYKDDHVSSAAFVKFPLTSIPQQLATHPEVDSDTLSAVIWTTTPWTLPANKAIAVNPDMEYSVVRSSRGQLLVATSRLDFISQAVGEDLSGSVITALSGSILANQTKYRSLFGSQTASPQTVLEAAFVTAESGSGLVHCAPGHGMEDYELCLRHGISAFAPLDDDGRFTEVAMPHNPSLLQGKAVLTDGNEAVISHLSQTGHLLARHRYQHKYPYDWRSKLPVIVRATEQWFADVRDLREGALSSLDAVQFIPEIGKARLESFVKSRTEWCISRQRAWGVPIPALYNKQTGTALLTHDSVSHVIETIKDRGIDSWWTDNEDDLAWIPRKLPEGTDASMYRRGTDTMDVWFDSGTSWTQASTPVNDSSGLPSPADVYIEGTDQHRGWFQSSLLTYIAAQPALTSNPAAPFKSLITHGFTLDQHGRKMSKSIGNVIAPDEIINGTLLPPVKRKGGAKTAKDQPPTYDSMGPDALRLWVASSDYTKDVVIGQPVLKAINSSLHKLRVTLKLLLGALEDFNPSASLPYQQLTSIDRMALLQLYKVTENVQKGFTDYEFHKAVIAINRWANIDFSAFYFESLKDRLYADAVGSPSRLAAQTVLYHIYHFLQSILGPITPILVEEAWDHTPNAIKEANEHPLRRTFSACPEEWNDRQLECDMPFLFAANAAVKTAQEVARSKKLMGSSLQSAVYLVLPEQGEASGVLSRYKSDLESIFVVSDVSVCFSTASASASHGSETQKQLPAELAKMESLEWHESVDFELPDQQRGLAWVFKPQKEKCQRCWRYKVEQVEQAEAEEALCMRCRDVVNDKSDTGSVG